MPSVHETGLTAAEAAARAEAGEANVVKASTSRSVKDIVRANVFTLFNGIILAAMALVLVTGSWRDAVFGFVIIINTGIGIVTELKAKRTLDSLSILVASRFLVRRDGTDTEVAHDQIVLGDLLWIRGGDQVPADAAIVRTWGLELDESMLTGESRTVRKGEGDPVYSGSTAVSGMALVRVTAVGEHSYAATLTAKAKVYKKTVSDLNKGINTILKFMTFLVVPLCALLIWSQMRTVGGWQTAIATGEWRQAVVSAVAGVVGMIPEGLVLLTSLNFAVAAMRLARQHTLVQELESVETLARVDCLNLDKTGTITDGGIAFDRLVMLGEHTDADREAATQACYDLAYEENPNGTGRAILEGLGERGYRPGGIEARVPFSSARKWSAIATGTATWYLGAPEVIVAALGADGAGTGAGFADLLGLVNEHADNGERVLLVARRDGPAPAGFADELVLDAAARPVALILCSERIRPDAARTLAWFREQGVRCRVISGDNPVTVGAIARKVRLTGDREPVAMDARDLPQDAHQLGRLLEDVDVLGRVLPEQKKLIVEALHDCGYTVAMTGDGVNDSLAIKEADLGIAMGNAAPATKAVAQVVLVDGRFSHLPDVVARGRQVMANMERVAGLFLVKTVYSALISLGVVLSGIPYPYLPRHITYVGALTIGVPAFVLALAPNTRRYIPGFLKRVVRFALPGGVATGLSVLLTAWILPGIMGWDILASDADLMALRSTSAVVLFLMGVFVLARVAQPLNSWRGVLVAAFAAAGVAGAFIPFVARFFALRIPTGRTAVATAIALGLAALIFFLCLFVAPHVTRFVERKLLRKPAPRSRR
ncbi:HAD-IC family P-type ATPase [Bifidobacterium pullorum]|nr:HAD-IC family P-type ATPase [Bifidobacterium pullorum]